MKTTLNKIREHSPCASGWKKILHNLGKTKADDEPLAITTILESNGLDDALWCLRAVDGHQCEMRLYAVDCARSVQHLMTDPCSIAAIDVAEHHAYGLATDLELAAARAAAGDSAWAAARAAAGDSAGVSAGDSAGDVQANLLFIMCAEIEQREGGQQMTDKDQAIAPCPFCGHVGLEFREGSTFRWLIADCGGCGASLGETRIQTLGEGTKEEWMAQAQRDAIEVWNTRKPAPDCRTCEHMNFCYAYTPYAACTNGDQYQPAPAVVLWRTE